MSAYNYAAAFVAFSQGSTFEDMAQRLGIPLETLKAEARQHGWKRMSNSLSKPVQELTTLDLSMADIQLNRKKSLGEAAPLELLLARTLDLYNRWWEELGFAEDMYKAQGALLDDWLEQERHFYTADKKAEAAPFYARVRGGRATDEDIAWIGEYEKIMLARQDAQLQTDKAEDKRNDLRAAAAPSPKALAELAKAVSQIQDIRYRAVGDLANKSADLPNPKAIGAQIIVNMPGAISQPREKRVIEVQPVQPHPLDDGT